MVGSVFRGQVRTWAFKQPGFFTLYFGVDILDYVLLEKMGRRSINVSQSKVGGYEFRIR